MSTNDRNEKASFDKNERYAMDSEGAPDGELSQDELDNVSGGLRAAAMPGQPDGRLMAGKNDFQDEDDKNDLQAR